MALLIYIGLEEEHMRKRLFGFVVAPLVVIAGLAAYIAPAIADESDHAHVETETESGVTLTVSYNDPVAGQSMTLQVSASGGSDQY